MTTDRELKACPVVVEKFADNGAHSHYELISSETGELLWSESRALRPEGGVWLRYPENRPPEIFKDYLVAFGPRPEIAVATYCDREDEDPDFDYPEVIAWMPLPDVRSLLPPQEHKTKGTQQ